MPPPPSGAGKPAVLLLAAALIGPGVSAAGAASAFLRALVPDQARLQFAGGQGLFSAGAGYACFSGRLQAELLYGYVPAAVAGEDIHALSQKSTLAPFAFKASRQVSVTPLIAGYSANIGLGESYFLYLPERYRDYYWPSALRFWFFGGARAGAALKGPGPIRAVYAVAEAGAHDVYWQAWFRNDFVSLGDILSLSLAVQFRFTERRR